MEALTCRPFPRVDPSLHTPEEVYMWIPPPSAAAFAAAIPFLTSYLFVAVLCEGPSRSPLDLFLALS
eukprot:568778-Pelagomonas_calceolata.AAC.2